ncbi:unnamed protein product [Lactuca saligna]|uniref:Myb/SANT-like domain-containing protein n=1 Tax=Lactuca saligna TaxID=75948 RepID=A0AA35VM78_LACSI|nr:unnamed protein product [Lactuca saligna]
MGDKHTWTNEQTKCLLLTCIEEVQTVGRKGLSLHKQSWYKLGTTIKEKYGMDLSQRQLKNAYDNLKAKYTGWLYLRNKTGNLYNPQTNTFNLTNEEWEDFKKGHPKAASLKTVPLLFPELCAELFDGNSASGNLSYATSQTPSGHGSSSFHVAPLHLMDAPSINIDEDDFFSNHTSEQFTQPSPSAASPSGNPNKRAKPSTPRPRAPSASPDPPSSASPKASITADDLALEMKKALRHLTQGPTIPQCLEKLELLELDPIDPLRFAAYHIFGGTMNMREMWVNLPNDPRILRGWIEMTTTSLGVLKDGKIVR